MRPCLGRSAEQPWLPRLRVTGDSCPKPTALFYLVFLSSAQQALILLEDQSFLDPGCLSFPLWSILHPQTRGQGPQMVISSGVQSFLWSLGAGRGQVLPGWGLGGLRQARVPLPSDSSDTGFSVSL